MTLTQAAQITKRVTVIGAVLFVVILSGYFSYQFYYQKYVIPNRPKYVEKPQLIFGTLPKLNFPESKVSSSTLSYILNTQTGNLPDKLPKLIKVYFVPQLGVTLLAPERAQKLAASLGFTKGPEALTPTKYQFTDPTGGQLTLDLDDGNFSFNRNVASLSTELKLLAKLPDQSTIIGEFKQFLQTKGLLNDQLRDGRNTVFYQSTPAESSSAAITIWPSDIDDMPIVTPTFTRGLIQANLNKINDQDKHYSNLDYIFWRAQTDKNSTYPIKSAQEAFDDLKAGNGIIISSPPKSSISITNVYLAYYESREFSPYIQPVFVFEGEGNFIAYVTAIPDQYLEKN